MASTRPPGGTSVGGTPTARLGIDLSALRAAPNVAREAGRGVSRELSQAFRTIQNEQRIVLEQARQATTAVRAQHTQITSAARAESSVRQTYARAEAAERTQQARVAANAAIEAERRVTAEFRTQLRQREAQQRAALRPRGAGFAGGVASAALGAVGGPVGAIAGAAAGGTAPAAVGLALAQGARFAVDAAQTATAYDRQSLAAKNLAGSTARLNELLVAYTRASGGAADKATALANVTRLQAVGFGDSAKEIERFTVAVRGSSIAMGKFQEDISQEVQLAISNQSLRRLDQIGLGITEVNNRIAELRANNQGMTREAAFQEAVLGLLIEKFGGLATSVKGQATGVEQLAAKWKDLRLEIGQVSEGPVGAIARGAALFIDIQTERLRAWTAELDIYIRLLRQIGITGPGLTSTERAFVGGSAGRDVGRHGAATARAAAATGPQFTPEQETLIVQRGEALREIGSQADRAILDQTRQYNQQRATTIANYEKSIAREAEDFGRQRANAERKLQMSILDVAQDSARQRAKWEADLARTIGQARADSAERVADMESELARRTTEARAESAERVAEWEEDRDEAVAEKRRQSTMRLIDIEEKFGEERERAERAHRDTLLGAAARFDAMALYEEQRRFAREDEEARKAHAEELETERAGLTEAINQIDEAHRERLEDERKSLDKSIRQQQEAHDRSLEQEARSLEKSITQQQEAHQRRLDEQAENDAQRIEDMKAAFEDQKRQEDIERGIRLNRQTQDHNDQLGEMARQQGERIQQIKDHAADERAQYEEEFNKAMHDAGVINDKWIAENERVTNRAIEDYTRATKNIELAAARMVGLAALTGGDRGHPSQADPYVDQAMPPGSSFPPIAPPSTTDNSTRTSSVTVAPTIVIDNAGARSDSQIQNLVEQALANALRSVIPGGFLQ